MLAIGSAALNIRTTKGLPETGTTHAVLTVVNNLEYMCAFPGYLLAWLMGHVKGAPTWTTSLFGAFVGWAIFFVVLATMIRIGRWIVRRAGPSRSPIARPQDAPAQASTDSESLPLSRRQVLVGATLAAPVVAAAGSAAYATVIEPFNLKTRRYTVALRGLPAELHGVRFVQLSDTHFGPRVPADQIAAAVRRAIELKPDFYLLTGDYIYDGVRFIPGAVELFEPLVRGPGARPTLATLGNHDWYGDGERCARMLSDIGVRMLDNTRVFLDAKVRELVATEPSRGSLCIAGLGDLIEDRIDPERALKGVDPETPRLVLAHNPDTAEEGAVVHGPRIDLMLSGHTHGGQCSLPFYGPPVTLSHYGRRYIGGVVQAPSCRVLVSRGIGTSILPIRFGVPPEVVELTLHRAE